MKVWRGYGSEHSMNLVMIGKFKSIDDAKKTKKLIDELTTELAGKIDIGRSHKRFEDDVLELLSRKKLYAFRPEELQQFLDDINTEIKGDEIIVRTDEADISAFIKLMINEGAKIEMFSAHDYPNADYERGK